MNNTLIALAMDGDAKAQYDLGLTYINPNEGVVDATEAFNWFYKSAVQLSPNLSFA